MEIQWYACVRRLFPAAAVLCGLLAPLAVAHAADARCPPAAVVMGAVGTEGMVASVVTLLRQHGVASQGSACQGRVVRASLDHDPDAGFHLLHIDDGFGRTSDRKVANANMAASLIESWALGEDAYLLSPRTQPAPVATTPATAPAGTVAAVASPAAAGLAFPAASAWRLAAAAEMSTDFDGHALYGAAATGCARVGAICVGGRGRIARGSEGTTLIGFDIARTAAELMATVSLPVTGRRFTFVPLLGLGAGWGRASALPEPVTVSREDFSLRAETAAMGGLRLGTHFAIVAEVGASVGRRVSADPTDPLADRLPPASDVTLRAAIGIEFAR